VEVVPEMKRKWNSSIKPVILVLFLFVANFAALGTASEHESHETHASESYANSSEHSGQSKGHGDEGHHGGIHLMSWRWKEFSSAIMFSSMIISAVILKIVFHHLPWLAKALPESCVLIVIGILSGTFIHYVVLDDILHLDDKSAHPFPQFTATLFFNILLPPIILDSALALYDQAFFDNFISVVIFAVFGTLFNVFSIGYSLYGLTYSGVLGSFTVNTTGVVQEMQLAPTECLIFSSLISAVDPVAVLAIFEEIHVNIGLYFLVFGESLFNDGVTVVLYNTMKALIDIQNVGALEIVMALLSFICVVLGGAIIGLANGLFASYVTMFTKHVRVVEPLIIFSSAYFSFLGAEVFHWSGIISIIAYGITIKRYGFQNISKKSYTTVKYSIKTLASTSDCIIFLFLGLELIQESHQFHAGFILATILLCLVFRFISTFLFAFLVNLARKDQIEYKEQFIMAYGGLRGAVGFSLAVVLDKDVWYRELYITTALAMVFFTVFLQGGTIKLFVKLFKIELQTKEKPKICNDVQNKLMDDVMEGIENVIGRQKAKGLFSGFFRNIDKLLKKMLIGKDSQQQIQRKFERICLDEHITSLYAPRIIAATQVCAKQTDKPKREVSFAESRKSFKKGVRASNWHSYKTKSFTDPTFVKKDIINMLEQRQKRSQTMESKVLNELWNDEVQPVEGKPNLFQRSKSDNWAAARKASKSANLIKAQYDNVQLQKRSSQSPLSSPRSATFPSSSPNPNFFTQNSISEEAQLLLSRKGGPTPETMV